MVFSLWGQWRWQRNFIHGCESGKVQPRALMVDFIASNYTFFRALQAVPLTNHNHFTLGTEALNQALFVQNVKKILIVYCQDTHGFELVRDLLKNDGTLFSKI